jgi:hypothetical protein
MPISLVLNCQIVGSDPVDDLRHVNPSLVRKLGMVLRRDKHLNRGLRQMMKSLRAVGS